VAERFTTRPELRGTLGVVASTHWLASAAGMGVLERGGNAVDAAVAAGLVLQVVEPDMNGPGGEVPILLWSAERGRVQVICGQGPAPRAASVGALRALGLDLVPGTGLLPACVPGAWDAWMLLLRDLGTLRLRDALAPALGYARAGFPLAAAACRTIAAIEPLLREEWTSSAEVYLRAGVPRPGTLQRNAALAATWERLVRDAERATRDRDGQIEHARDAFYRGWVAEAIASHAERPVLDTSGRRHAGLLDAGDLAAFAATWEEPVSSPYHGLEVHKTGPWSQGPVLLQALGLVEGFDLAGMGIGSATWVHTVVECLKLALADRDAWYADPDFADVPLDALLSPAYADERRALVGDEASHELRPGAPAGRTPRLPTVRDAADGRPRGLGAGEPTLAPAGAGRGDTCHLDVADAAGNLVAATPSGGWLQSSPVVAALGFPLGTRAQMFWLDDGLPGSLEGGKRPRTTLTPSIATRDGEPYLAWGTPGGDQQDQWGLLLLLNHLHGGLDLQAAIDAPAFHTNHLVSSFYPREARLGEVEAEGRLDPAALDELRARGHRVRDAGPWALGRLSAAGPAPEGGLRAAANARGMQGYAAAR
jgi:gamma-glutamyltranspeptidase/glutathione hydrolase